MPSIAEVKDMLLLEWERRRRLRQQEEAPKYDWYGPPCGCKSTREDGSCPVHHRARANQRPPEVDWENWLLLMGRGAGKTRSGCEWLNYQVKHGPPNSRWALVGQQASDVRDILIEGESGILAISPPWFKPQHFPSKKKLVWPNGAIAHTYSSEEPGQFRGPQFHGALCDEAAKWSSPDECYDNLQFGLRLGRNQGWSPKAVWTTTPLPIGLIKMLLADPRTAVSRGSTFENAANLAESTVERFRRKYEGTRLGRQELYAEVLDDVPGALWKSEQIDKLRVPSKDTSDLVRIVVAIDPSIADPNIKAWDEDKRAEAGIVVAGRDEEDEFYVLEDASLSGTPQQWAEAAVACYHKWQADRIVAEVNNGGAMVEAVIRTVDEDVAYEQLWASRGKQTRAEPVAALYEQARVHHVGQFPKLEAQMCSWMPGLKSPDRMDALVWAITELQDNAPATWAPHPFPDFRG